MNLDDMALLFGTEEDGSITIGDKEDEEVVASGEPEVYEESEVAIVDPIDTLTDSMEGLGEAQIGMEEIYGAIETFLSNGGMDQNTALITQIAVRNACARFPVIEPPKMPGIESFQDAGSRMEETLLGLEAADSWWQKALDWAQALLAKFINMITGVWKRWTLSATGIARKAAAVRTVVKAFGTSAAPKAKISLSEVDFHNLSVNKTVNAATATAGITKLSEAITRTGGKTGSDAVITTYVAEVNKALSLFKPAAKDQAAVDAQIEDGLTVEKAVDMFKSAGTGLDYTHVEDAKHGTQILRSQEFIGAKAVVVQFKGAMGAFAKVKGAKEGAFKGLSVNLRNGPSVATVTGKSVELAGLSTAEIDKLLASVASICAMITKAKTNDSARATALKSLNTTVSSIKSKLAEDKVKASSPALYSYIKAYLTACSTLPTALYNPGTDLARHGLVVSKSAINFSIKSYQKMKEEKAAAAK